MSSGTESGVLPASRDEMAERVTVMAFGLLVLAARRYPKWDEFHRVMGYGLIAGIKPEFVRVYANEVETPTLEGFRQWEQDFIRRSHIREWKV